MKKVLKTIGLVSALAVAFAMGLAWTAVHELATSFGGPIVHSDYLAREHIKQRFPELPETAHHLYYAIHGLQDPDEFFACSVPEADYPLLLAQVTELARSLANSSAGGRSLSRCGPDSWDDSKKDPLWDMSSCVDLTTLSTNGIIIMHSPAKHRVFVFRWL